MSKYYAGIGARISPPEILDVMHNLAKKLATDEWALRSGGAKGADSAFEEGACSQTKQIFYGNNATPEAMELAGKFHPAWDKCKDYVHRLHGRNAMIILGKNLDNPVKMVVCWTPNAEICGGTGLGIKIAEKHGIPIRNLANPEILKSVMNYLKG